MLARKSFSILIILGAVFAVMLAAGCAANQETRDTTTNDRENRAVTPEVDWSLEDVRDAEDEEDLKPVEGDGSGGAPSEEFPVPGNVEFEIYADGERLPEGMPLSVFPEQEVNLLFRLIATGSELAMYSIEADTIISVPQEGRLSGYQADVEYNFTFNMDTWRDGGITITVANRSGTMFTANVQVYPEPLPGLNPE